MKVKRNLIQIWLLCAAMLPGVIQAQFTFTTNNGAITITGYTGTDGAVVIPYTTNGHPVTTIGNFVFSGRTSVTNVTIPDSVTVIEGQAFYNCGITGIEIPNSVTSIWSEAFGGCLNLTTITIPASVTDMGVGIFEYCQALTNIAVEASNPAYASVGGVLFNKSLGTLWEYPPGIPGNYAIPNTVTNIGDWSFRGCLNLTRIVIPGSVSSIGNSAFEDCLAVTNLTIPNGILNIGEFAFDHCVLLTSALIPASVTYFGPAAFEQCGHLNSLTVDVNNVNYMSSNGVIFTKDGSTLVECASGKVGSYTIPDSVTRIGDYAFASSYLTNVTIPDSVINIGWDAFSQCYNLNHIYFEGNAPAATTPVFYNDPGMIYYLPGTTGWGANFGGLPTAPWYRPSPAILGNGSGLGVNTNGFGFTVSWATNTPVVIEVCTNLANPAWVPVSTNVLANGTSDFRDAQWANFPQRFYRIRSQ